MPKPEEYGVAVRLVREGGEELYEARVLELPDVRVYGQSYADAYLAAIEVISTTQQIFAEKAKPFPDVARPEEEFSGRVTLRMSKSLHRATHDKALQDAVSLNQWLVEAAAARVEGAMIPASSVVVACAMRTGSGAGAIRVQLQHAIHWTTLPTGANLFLTQSAERVAYLQAPMTALITDGTKHG